MALERRAPVRLFLLCSCLLIAVSTAAAASRGRGDGEARGDLSGNPDPEAAESPHQLLLKRLAAARKEHTQQERAVAEQQPSGGTPQEKAKKDTPAEQLAKLAALNSEGILDNEEYLAAKAKVMAELKRDRARSDKAAAQKQGRKSETAGAENVGEKSDASEKKSRHAAPAAGAAVHAAAEAHAEADGAAAAASAALPKAKRHKLVGKETDQEEASILDRYHEYTDENDQQSNAPPGQQGGEKLQPQSKSFFSDVRREAHKVDAKHNFPSDMLEAMDLDVEPCDDFYEHACGTFLKEAVIPDYLTAYTLTWDRAKSQVISEMQELLTKDPGEAGAFYRTCLDEAAVEKAGATPLTAWFQAIAGVTDMDSLSSFLATAGTYNWCGFFCWHVSMNAANPERNKFVVSHVATTMPDRKYYVEEGEDMDGHRQALLQAMEDLLLAAGAPSQAEAHRQAQVAFAIESDVARSMVTKERFRHIHPVKVSRERIKEISPSVNWDIWFEGMGLSGVGLSEEDAGEKAGDLYLHDFHYLENLEENVWSKYSFDDIRIYLILRAVNVYTPYLASAFTDAKMVLNDDLYGMTEKSPRERKCYFLVVRQFKESVGKLFVDEYFPEVAENAAQQMLGDIRGAFEEHLETLHWMDADTRESAVEKLENMGYQVGYPDGWPMLARYGTLDLTETSLYENIVIVAQAHSQQERDRLFEEPIADKWSHAATTTNAYYSRNKNALFIPAGILQPPFFSPDFPDSRNYGGIGSVLGHEMTHGFDDSGRKYDANGERNNWWDPATEEYFEDRAACLVKQFDNFTVSGGKHVSGNLTLGENIADGGGLRMSYKAYLKRNPGASAWDKQMFFLAYAQIWCGVQRPKAAQAHVLKGVHSPKRYRVIGTLRDSWEFADAFGCKAGDPMNPEDKCVVW